MQLDTIVSELDNFWLEQNQKLCANPLFLKERGSLLDDHLYFRSANQGWVTKLDFTLFEFAQINIVNAATLTLNEKAHQLSFKEYAKLLVINNISHKSTYNLVSTFQMLLHLAAFLKREDVLVVTPDILITFYQSYLAFRVNEKGHFLHRISPPSYKGSIETLNFSTLRLRLNTLGVRGVFDFSLTTKSMHSALGVACQSVMGVTLNEYRKGGSYNFLTLELGQYYIDYQRHVYDEDYFYTLVCVTAIRDLEQRSDLQKTTDLKIARYWKQVMFETIQGNFSARKYKSKSEVTRDKINSAMEDSLFRNYQLHFDKTQSLRESNIYQVVKKLGLEMRFDSVEIIRVLMLQKYHPIDVHKSPKAVWNGYLNSLDKTKIDFVKQKSVTLENVYACMHDTIIKSKVNRKSFLKDLNQWVVRLLDGKKAPSISYLTKEFERVSDAMTCLVVAWLGYRKSEFGFPLDAIHIEPNLDILDNSHVPFRFKLKWFVPKTNGSTKLDREITSQCYQICAQLSELFQSNQEKPCLYINTGGVKFTPTHNKSSGYISTRIKSNWLSFVYKYQPFNDVTELQRLSSCDTNTLTILEKTSLEKLAKQYNLSSARDRNLLQTCQEVRSDLVKLKCTSFYPEAYKEFKESLHQYIQTRDITLSEHKLVMETCLSESTRQKLLNNEVVLDEKSMSDISNEILQGVRYPSSHAFRHIWAEAVLSRYQGDIGAVIRHQFCHLDESFFMAYLRDKEAKFLMQTARVKVLNSIVDTLLVDSKHVDREYLGGFSRYIKKASSLTKVVTPNELQSLRAGITGRVISLQSSHFATCVPREGGESRAKCSEFGEMNPHNAKPSFCLGCTNALITEGNLKGIWITIQPFVKEALNEDVMGFMLEHHLPMMRSAERTINGLRSNTNSEQIAKILGWIHEAIVSIQNKLKSEENLYA